MVLYVTEMLRWGDDESHHYIVGAFTSKESAEQYGDAHKSWRGGKYEFRVVPVVVDEVCQEIVDYHKGCV